MASHLLAAGLPQWPEAAAAEPDDLRISPELYCEEFVAYEAGAIAELETQELLRRGADLIALPLDKLRRLDAPTLCFAARHYPGRLSEVGAALQSMKADAKDCTPLWERLCNTDRQAILNSGLRRLNQGFPPKPTCDRLRDFMGSAARVWNIRGLPSPVPCSGPYYNLAMALYNLRRLTYADHLTDPSLRAFHGRVPTLYEEILGRRVSLAVESPQQPKGENASPPECHEVRFTLEDLGPAAIAVPVTLPGIDPSLVVADAIAERIVHEARRTYRPDYPANCGARAEFLSGRARNRDPGPVDCERGPQACDLAFGSWWGGAHSWSVLWWNIVETFPGKLDTIPEIDRTRRFYARYRKYHCIQNCFLEIPSLEQIARILNARPPKAPSVNGFLRAPPSGPEVKAFDAPGGNWVWSLRREFWSHITEVRGNWLQTVIRDPQTAEVSRVWVNLSEVELLP